MYDQFQLYNLKKFSFKKGNVIFKLCINEVFLFIYKNLLFIIF